MTKYLVLAMTLAVSSLMSTQSFAAVVRSARLDAGKRNILVDVRYGGGCKEHHFVLEIGMCRESMPVSCDASLVDLTSDDFCEAIVGRTVVLPLAEYGLTESYFRGGTLRIQGDLDDSGRPSSVTVRLP